MILDLPINVTIDLGLVMLSMIFYGFGLVTVMAISKYRATTAKREYHADDAVVEAIVLEYTRRLKDYDRTIAEMKAKIDIVEGKTQTIGGVNGQQQPLASIGQPQQQTISSPSSMMTSHPHQPSQPHAQYVSEHVMVTQHTPTITSSSPSSTEAVGFNATSGSSSGSQNGTVDYILKLLAERSRTSREIQQAIGRTREHTARLMKKLHEGGLVSREVNSKPFRYNITESGRAMLTNTTKERTVGGIAGDNTASAQAAPEIQQL